MRTCTEGMSERSEGPGFEYARLCELQADVADLREAMHTLQRLIATRPQNEAAPSPGNPQAAAGSPGAGTPGGGGGGGWSVAAYVQEMKSITQIAYAAVRKFNETQKLLPPVGPPGNVSFATLMEAVPDVQSVGSCSMTAEEEERLKQAQQIRLSRAQNWAARAEHFDRIAHRVETKDYAITGVPSMLALAGVAAEAQNNSRNGMRPRSSSSGLKPTLSSSKTPRPLYDHDVQDFIRAQIESANGRIRALIQRDNPHHDSSEPFLKPFFGRVSLPRRSPSSGAGNAGSSASVKGVPAATAATATASAVTDEMVDSDVVEDVANSFESVRIVSGVTLLVFDVFVAIISFGPSGTIANVSVLSVDEATFVPRSGGQARVNSEHIVFRDLSAFAMVAARYFERIQPNSSLVDFLVWLYSYEKLFSEPCVHCGALLVPHQEMIPPVCRDFVTFQPYHHCCLAHIAPIRVSPSPVSSSNSFSANTMTATVPAATAAAAAFSAKGDMSDVMQ